MPTVLAIDDSKTTLKIVTSLLTDNGFEALTAVNGKEGLDKAQNQKPDAIILDRQMPEMDGNQALLELKAGNDTKNIPVIMLTADDRIGDISTCLEMGAVDYIVKPFDEDNFLIRLKKALRDANNA